MSEGRMKRVTARAGATAAASLRRRDHGEGKRRRGDGTTDRKRTMPGRSGKGFRGADSCKLVGAGALATTVSDAVKPGRAAAAAAPCGGDRNGGNGPDQPARQRPAPPVQGRAPLVSAGGSPGKTGADRRETRLRPRRMRRLHGPDRRPAALRLSDPGRWRRKGKRSPPSRG